ncbi:hypothetical protein AB0G32_29165 [Streptomyces sp. NPDC023723]|uniref:hypothetical protein n=1 Tax=Streptomyces sp. NPDC023723 TaxID=3154323 RepID=UPI0033D0FD2A
MRHRIRITRRPAALMATLAALLATASGPAAADASGEVLLRLETPGTHLLYHADEGADARVEDFPVPVAVAPSAGGDARDVEVVVDTTGLKGVAVAEPGGAGNCTNQGPVFTCVYGDVQNGDGESNIPFLLRGVDGVVPGDSGTVTYRVTAANASPVTGLTRMTVGGPTLHTPKEAETVTGAAPGEPRAVTPAFANRSRFTASEGVALLLTAPEGLRLTSRPANCRFNTDSTSAWCLFATEAGPGTAYRTGSPLHFTAEAGRLSGTLSYSWSAETTAPADHPERGDEAPLKLTRTSGTGLTADRTEVHVETTVQADYEPVTATVRGRVGDTVTVRLGLRDHGPGRLLDTETLGGFRVIPPEGTTVTSVPYTFEDSGGDWACERPRKSDGSIDCAIGDDDFYEVRHEGGTTVIGFRVRIDRRVPGAHGTIRTYNHYDRTPGNDTAAIPLDASPALPYRPYRDPLVWSALGVGAAVAVGLVVRRRRRV